MRAAGKYMAVSVLCSLFLVGCAQQHSETLESSDTVKVHTNNDGSQSATSTSSTTSTSDKTSTDSQASGAQTGSIVNKLAAEAIKKIETKKGVILDDSFVIIVQSQTDDVIEINIRKKTNDADVTTSYGFFKYTKSTNALEQRNDENAAYEEIK